ncbi:DUF4266 domain-containing protein [Chryseobacterium binzhouense]|jgi:Domain of unknown function (DUF4266)|uniref:DUF4266 domain-containing protein n=1 Tax=Chryseobacterium binzhouense TaxID=2593646 RepID=UPI00406A6294
MTDLIKHSQKLFGYLFGQLSPSSTPAFLLVPHKKSSVQAGLRRFNVLNYKAIAVLSIVTIPLLNSCTTVKEYEKNKLNDAEMVLGNRTIEKTELSFQSYREGSSGANAGKVGGGCGCN